MGNSSGERDYGWPGITYGTKEQREEWERRGREEAAKRLEVERQRTNDPDYQWQQAKEADIPERFRNLTFADYQPVTESQESALATVREFVDDFAMDGRGLLLAGPVGTGKTHLAAVALKLILAQPGRPYYTEGEASGERYVREHYPYSGLFIAVPEFLGRIRRSFDDSRGPDRDLGRRAGNLDVLLFDDLGSERLTDWGREQLFIVLNRRYEDLKTTLVTTNLSGALLQQTLGERTVSRLEEMCQVVIVDGPDHRKRMAE